MIQFSNHRIFYEICKDTCVKCINHSLDYEDADFIESLPHRVEMYGFDYEFGVCLQERFRCIIRGDVRYNRDILNELSGAYWDDDEYSQELEEDAPKRKRTRGARQPYVVDPRVKQLYEAGHSIRTIQRVLGVSKFNIERMVRPSTKADQMFLSFFIAMMEDGTL